MSGETPQKHNLAFVDGQNLYFGTTKCYECAKKLEKDIKDISLEDCTCGYAWEVNLHRFRIYLNENYNVSEAYYWLGNLRDRYTGLYNSIQKAGFIVQFKEHHKLAKSKKKGNVDTDIVFEIMKNLIDNENLDKIILISSDGDYKKLVSYLISKEKFGKILFPNRQFASSLYEELGSEYFDYLDNLKEYIGQNEKGS